LTSMANNPQALVSTDAQNQLISILSSLGAQETAAFNQIIQAMRQSLSSALTQVFLISMVIILLAFIINFFLREIPLRKKHTLQTSSKNPDTIR
jgi:hypothetical protein